MKKNSVNFLSRLRGSLTKSLQQPRQTPDINEQLNALREADVKITFRDIWLDYKMYRRSYFFFNFPDAPKKVFAKNQVSVDVDAFRVRDCFKWVIMEGHN